MPETTYNIVNNEREKQFEIELEGEKAYLVYRYYKDDIALMHTFVPKSLEGRGIAGALARGAFSFAEKHNLPVIVYCTFVAVYLKKHPELKKQLDSSRNQE